MSPTPMPRYEIIQNQLLVLTEFLFLNLMAFGQINLTKFTKIPCQMLSTMSLLIGKNLCIHRGFEHG